MCVAGVILHFETYIADVYKFPFAFGGLSCNGSEQSISMCNIQSNCGAQPPALPGSTCCNRGSDNFIAMRCICKFYTQAVHFNKYIYK